MTRFARFVTGPDGKDCGGPRLVETADASASVFLAGRITVSGSLFFRAASTVRRAEREAAYAAWRSVSKSCAVFSGTGLTFFWKNSTLLGIRVPHPVNITKLTARLKNNFIFLC